MRNADRTHRPLAMSSLAAGVPQSGPLQADQQNNSAPASLGIWLGISGQGAAAAAGLQLLGSMASATRR